MKKLAYEMFFMHITSKTACVTYVLYELMSTFTPHLVCLTNGNFHYVIMCISINKIDVAFISKYHKQDC
ncbi:Uncharacterised protein [uncultured archaeon]|nr:Uncharacterised protein [uncultured archaeon]